MKSLLGGLVTAVSNRAGISSTTYSDRNLSGGLFGNGNGSKQQMDEYGNVSTLFSIVSRIAYSTSEVKWRLFKTRTDNRRTYATPQDDDRTEVKSHVALDLWEKPNEFTTGQQFREAVQQHQELTGEQWWIVGRNPMSPMPLELWPVRPDRMAPIADPDRFIRGYVFTDAAGVQTFYGVDEVIRVLQPSPLDPYRGLGVVQALMVDLGSGSAAAEWQRNFFANSAAPGGVIEFDKHLSDTEFDEFAARYAENHRGVRKAHRVAMMDNGAKWKDSQLSMRDMQFGDLRGLTREIIREAFGMHPHMLGLSEDVNRANAEAAETVFGRWMLKPRLTRVRDALNHQLLPLFGASGAGLEFDFDDPTLEDGEAENAALTARANAFKTLHDAGADWDSALEAVGLPAIEQGERRPMPAQLTAVPNRESESAA